MITKKGTYLLEYNVRMGDPETQSVLTLMESDLVDLVEAALDNRLNEVEVKWYDGACVNVVLASSLASSTVLPLPTTDNTLPPLVIKIPS